MSDLTKKILGIVIAAVVAALAIVAAEFGLEAAPGALPAVELSPFAAKLLGVLVAAVVAIIYAITDHLKIPLPTQAKAGAVAEPKEMPPVVKQLLGTIISLGLALLLMWAAEAGIPINLPAANAVPDAPVQLGTTHFTNVQAEDVTATDDLTATDDVVAGDDLTVGDDAAVTGDATISGYTIFGQATVFELVAGGAITPTSTYMPITSTAAVTTSTTTAIVSGTIEGTLLVLCNENASAAIIIDDGANTALGGNKTLTGGQSDCLTLMWDGTDWCAIGYNDN